MHVDPKWALCARGLTVECVCVVCVCMHVSVSVCVCVCVCVTVYACDGVFTCQYMYTVKNVVFHNTPGEPHVHSY